MASERIYRKPKKKNFCQISNALANDHRLSFAARGMLLYLLSKPVDWEVRMSDLEDASPAGRHATRTVFKELQEFGYAYRRRTQGEKGQWTWETWIYEEPEDQSVSPIDQSATDQESIDQPTIDQLSIDGPAVDNVIRMSTNTDLDSDESHHSAGADCLRQSPASAGKRKVTNWERTRHELAEHFTAETGIKIPKQGQGVYKHRQSIWWGPLRTIYDSAGEDVPKAKVLITQVVAHMRKEGLTIVAPVSIEKMSIAQAAEVPKQNGSLQSW